MNTLQHIGVSPAFIVVLLIFHASISAQTTAFTYQGSLTDGGNPASGNFQIQFKLFDTASGGTQIGSTLNDVAVNAANGAFKAQLDFGAAPLSGANRWLEIAVRRNSGESYVTLGPRSQITSAPYAVKSASAETATTAVTAATATNATQLGGLPPSRYVQLEANGNLPIGTPTAAPGYKVDINTNGGGVRAFNAAGSHFVAEATGGINPWARYYMRTPNQSWYMGSGQAGDFSIVDETFGRTRFAVGPAGGYLNLFGAVRLYPEDLNPGFRLEIRKVNDDFNFYSGGSPLVLQNNTSSFQLTGTGDMVANLGTPENYFRIVGRARLHYIPLGASNGSVCYNAAADLITCGASSLKLKKNVVPFRSGLDVLTKLRPISYDWKDGSGHDIGLGAEDVAKVDPSLTFKDKTSDLIGVKYERLNILLINAVKEQQKQLDEQRRLITEQQTQLFRLKSLVCSRRKRAPQCK